MDDVVGGLELFVCVIRQSGIDESVLVAEYQDETGSGAKVTLDKCSPRTRRRIESHMSNPPDESSVGNAAGVWWPFEVEAVRRTDQDHDAPSGHDSYEATCPCCGYTELFTAPIAEIDGVAFRLNPHDCRTLPFAGQRQWPVSARNWHAVRLV